MDFLGYAYMALGFVVFVVAIGIGASVLSGMQAAQYTTAKDPLCTGALLQAGWTNCSTAASNATGFGLTGMTNLATQSGNIGLIIGAVIIIGLLLSAFIVSRK